MVTRRVQLRAGSVVAPLHHPVRLAENWAVVDNLSNGRVELSFASGWHADDFVFAPDSYDRRKEVMADTIESVRRLWRGEELTWKGGRGQDVAVRLRPRPVQPEPRFWMTSAGNVETFREAGRLGFCVLTHLLGQRPADLALKIAEYRQSFAGAGHDPQNARVALMLHTYIGESIEDVVATVREPFCGYLRQSLGLMARLMQVLQPDTETVDASPDDIAAMIHHGFERYMGECGLLGTPQDCALKVLELQALGVDEIACLADFGVEEDKLFASLERLVAMRRDLEGMRRRARTTVAEQIRQYGVTHLQCTPSLMRMLLDDPAMTEALPKLHALLLGGEALPPSLVQALAPNMPVRLINMYGPTETTIWSSYADVLPSEPITIGRPLANNRLYVLDAQRAPVPVGVPGELYIGGAGVVRGYLKRPQLTAQRFLVDTMSGHPGARMYKTGDRVRRLPNGRLEFLGRLDHQIKIRGHRVELGEIESLLARVPGILEAVVHPWPGPQGDVRLAAYLVMDRERLLGDGATDAGSERIDRWRAVWDQTYADPAPDPAFDITGWRSSYDGRPIASEQMHEWVDEAGLKILAEEPTSCLEIGCGSGLLLYRIAPHCTRYRAVDFSQRAVAAIAGRLDEAGLADIVEVRQREAADLVGEPARAYDVVVLNSVAQYFPDGEYLLRILPRVEELVADGGRIFLGDLRSLELLDAFHASVAAAQEGDGIDPLRSRFLRTVEQEEELLVSPAFFGTLDRHLERLRGVRLVLKAGSYDNEMNRFRYDAVLHIGPPQDPAGPLPESLHARGASIEPDRLREALASDPAALVLRDLADPRTSPWVRLAKTLRDPQATDLPAATGSGRQEIEALVRLAEELGYRHEARVSASGLPDTRDVLLWDPQRAEGPLFTGVPRHQTQVDASFFNDPLRGKLQREYAALVNQELGAQLPKYMLPSSCTVLSAFPMTPNGKVDRKALPEPNRASHATRDYSPPSTPIERLLVELWESVLGMNMVGIHDDFFDLGGDSLTATQVVHLVRKELDSDLPFHVMFDAPTIAQLAVQLEAR